MPAEIVIQKAEQIPSVSVLSNFSEGLRGVEYCAGDDLDQFTLAVGDLIMQPPNAFFRMFEMLNFYKKKKND